MESSATQLTKQGSKCIWGYFQGRLLGAKSLRGGIWNFCYPRRGFDRPRLMYAHPLNVCEAYLLREMSPPSNNSNDSLRSVFNQRWVSGNLSSYYEMAHDSDLITFGNLLYGKNVSFGKGRVGSFVRTSGSRGPNASGPIDFKQYLYNRSSKRRSGQIFSFLKVLQIGKLLSAGVSLSGAFFKPCVFSFKHKLLDEVGKYSIKPDRRLIED